ARRITVEVEGGGRRLIRVLDDGCGMTEAEARMALVRHATSKLRALDDLVRLRTMGFRGEALPSIAAVSRLSLTTRRAGGGAVRIAVDGGRVVSSEETGAPVGTTVEVRDLLWNVPARLKFMKGDATEMGHVSETVTRIAMAHPDVHIRLVSRGRTALEAPPSRDGFERVSALVGPAVAERMCRAQGGESGVSVEAYLGAPELAQTTTRGLHFYVGRRWVRDRGLVQSVLLGYGELVPRGRYPNAVVFVELDGADVDVNVHPQKLEVRFSDPQAVYAAVRHAVRNAVAKAPWLGEGGRTWAALGAIAEQRPWSGGRASEAAREYASRLSRSLFTWRADGTPPEGHPVPQQTDTGRGVQDTGNERQGIGVGERSGIARTPYPVPRTPRPVAVQHEDTQEGFFASLTYLGQLDLTYLLCEREGELVLVDQHAAHERVMFQRLVEKHRARSIPRQQLLFPLTVPLDPKLASVAEEAMEQLGSVGFEIEPFGEATGGQSAFALKSAPAELRAGEDPAALLRQLLAELVEHGGSRAVEDRLEAVLATLACHSSVRAGDPLSPPEVASLFASLDAIDFRAHCPHGRPVLLRIRVDEIARRFGRS
ncbi:MAG TPA: DNA mismatch repair endonuclease MutL, partial [Kofleriaceae bacterium]|nr:DNA mismatch repair endonuclease MutL [Kofleriaceae bacterium]